MAKEQYSLGQVTMRTGGRRMKVMEKPKDFKGAWLMILRYCARYLPLIAGAILCAFGGVIIKLFTPDILSQITDMISDGMESGFIDLAFINRKAMWLIICYVAYAILTSVQTMLMVQATQTIMYVMRTDINNKLNRLPLKSFDSASFGDLLSRVTNDVDTIGMSLNGSIESIVRGTCTIVGCIIMMYIKNWKLATISVVTSGIGFALMNYIIHDSQKYFSNRSTFIGLLYGHIEEMFAGHNVVKVYNGERSSKEEFDEYNKKLYENNWKSQFYSGLLMPIMQFVNNFSYLAICVVGAVMTKKGEISYGTIIAFISYMRMYSRPLEQISQSITNLMSAAAGGERVFSFLSFEEMEDESKKTEKLTDCKGHVVFDHVKFGYDEGKTIIKDFSADIKPGQKIAIVGPTGAGKTTLVNLLMRFYEIWSGKITIDGIDIRDITRENVHDLFSMVLQDTWLFNGTVRENIVYRSRNVSDERVIEVCKAVGLHHYFSSLPDGYDTVLDEESNLSAGQMQLLTIARAMIQNAPLLILDEATSSVDTRTEQLVQNAMEKLTEGRTSFTIAHRLSTIRNADAILVLKDGDIVEMGRHQELLDRNGFYAQLWNSQFTEGETI